MELADPLDWLRQSGPTQLYAQTLYQQEGCQTTLLMLEADDDDAAEPMEDTFERFTRFSADREL